MRERDIFMAALDIVEPDRQAAYLDVACAGDPALRQRLAAMLHTYHKELGSFLEQPVLTQGAGGSSPPDGDSRAAEGPGTRIGRYKLLQQIGEGGFGVVYMAEQTEPVRRKVALKIIKPGMDTKEVVARLEAERQALALMDHPNIARVLDAGATDGGRPFFVLELVKGVPITEYCDQNQLTPRERLALFVDVCRAVQHAHQKGIIHRDLKPSNVLVSRHDGTPVVKVIDFGIAKALGQRLTDKTLFTNFAQMVGTPLYMSPEQAGLSDLDVDTRSDIYSLGVLLYELLTGTTPFDRERLRTAGYDEMRRIIREEEPPRPSTRLNTLGQAASTVAANRKTEAKRLSQLFRGELDWVVMKALEKDRNRRYESASAFAADVERYLADEAVQACPPSAGYRLRKFVRRNRGPVLAGGALAALLVLGTAGTSVGLVWALEARRAAAASEAAEVRQRREAEAQRDRARTAGQVATEEAAIAKAVNDFLRDDLLKQAAPDKNARKKQVTVEEVLGRAAERIGGRFEAQPRVEAAIRLTIGWTYYQLGEYPAAQPHLERALELRRRVHGDEHADTLEAMNKLAGVYLAQGQFAKAASLLARALEVSRRVLGEEHPDTLDNMGALGLAYQVQGQPALAEPLWVRTLEMRRRVQGDEDPKTLGLMNNLAALYWTQQEFAKAEPLFAQVLEVSRRVLGGEHSQTLAARNNLAGVYQDQGHFDKSEPLKVGNLEISRRVLGEEHPSTLDYASNLGLLYQAQGRLAEAEPIFVQTLEVSRRALGEEHPHTLFRLSYLASLYRDQGQLTKAEPLYVRTLEVRRRVLGEDHPYTLYSLNHLATLYQAQGQLAKGEQLCREALEKARKRQGGMAAQTADALAALGENLLKQQKCADAEPLLRECLRVREQRPPLDWKTFHTQSLLGGSLLGQKKHADAEPLLVAGYEGLREREARIPVPSRTRLAEALERLVQLYEATAQNEQAAVWRKKLEARTAADKKPQEK
jgi:eukaryotic-like serine/threonine-protein kinase